MRGKRRRVATVLADALAARPEARLTAAAAAFAEAVGWPLAREAHLRALTRDGRIIAVVRAESWAGPLRAQEPAILERVNARLGAGTASAIEVRVAPIDAR
jgi:hypothetical protein